MTCSSKETFLERDSVKGIMLSTSNLCIIECQTGMLDNKTCNNNSRKI